jgi:hypothetical protein
MLMLRILLSILSWLPIAASPVFAHSDASMFGAPVSVASDHHDHPAEAVTRYPASLSVDPRRLVGVTVKINARITGLNKLYVGKRLDKGDVLAEMESAELETVQGTYLALKNNMDAVSAFSMTGNEKLIDARMNLAWRGMSEADIKRLDAGGEVLKTVPIKAPVAGFLYSLDVVNNQILNTGGQVGQYTATGTVIATIAGRGAIQIEAFLPASAAMNSKPGQRATVYVPDAARGELALPAKVDRVYAYVNPANQRQRVRLKLVGTPPQGVELVAGQLASASIGKSKHVH